MKHHDFVPVDVDALQLLDGALVRVVGVGLQLAPGSGRTATGAHRGYIRTIEWIKDNLLSNEKITCCYTSLL